MASGACGSEPLCATSWGTKVLELGVGTGNLQLYLLGRGYDAWGTDFSPQMLRQASRKARRHGARFNMCRAKAQALPFPNCCANSVVSTFPSDYIIDPLTLWEIYRVLRPGGRFVVAPGGWLRPGGKRSNLLELVSRLVYGDRSGGTGIEETEDTAAEQLKKQVTGSTWIGLLSTRMEGAGLSSTSRLLSNGRGSVLVVTGDKPQTSTSRNSPVGD